MKIFSILILLNFSILFLFGCSEKVYTRSGLCFDTIATITLYDGGSDEILSHAFSRIEELEKTFNAFDPESEIRKISTDPQVYSPELTTLIRKNLDFSAVTGGYFSPTLGALIELWNINEPEEREPPAADQVSEALSHSSVENLKLSDSGISVTDAEEKVNLGASVKGYVSDLLKDQLVAEGVRSGIINLGGNITLIGDKAGEGYTVGIDNPVEVNGAPIGTLELSDLSIVTSGSYQRYFYDSRGNKYHHILDPHTGYPADSDLLEVTVVSDSSLEGDMLSTALFAMGLTRARKFLESYNSSGDIQTIFVTKEKKIILSEKLKDNFRLSSGYENEYTVE